MRPTARLISPCLLIASFALAPSPAFPAAGRWTPFGPPEGKMTSLAIGPAGRLHAATTRSNAYQSTDHGDTWSWSGRGMDTEWARAIVFDPDDDELYAVTETRFFRSGDGGETWRVVARSLPFQDDPYEEESDILVLAPGEPDTLFLGHHDRLFRSTDEGSTWEQVLDTPTPVAAVLVDPNDPRSVFVGLVQDLDGYALLHSADGGDSWEVVRGPALPFEPTDSFAYGVTELTASETAPTTLFAISALTLYRSADAGATWQRIPNLPAPAVGYSDSVVVTPGPRPAVYTIQQISVDDGGGYGLFISRDMGNTWSRVDAEGVPVGSLRVDPETGDLYVLSPFGVGQTADGGRHWRLSPLGTPFCNYSYNSGVGAKLRFHPRNRSRLYAVAACHLWTSADAGKSWSALGEGVFWNVRGQQAQILDLAIDPRRSHILHAAAAGFVFRSTDAGETWSSTNLQRFVATIAASGNGTVVAGGSGSWQSVDRGATWSSRLRPIVLYNQFNEPEFERIVNRVRIDPADPRIVYAEVLESGERHPPEVFLYIYRSTDGGRTWRRILPGAYVVAIDPGDPRTLYALGNGVFRSRDRGESWQRISGFMAGPGAAYAGPQADLAVDPFDRRTLYAARYDGVWRSRDGGVTWAPLSDGLRGRPAFGIFPDPRRQGRLYAAALGGLYEGTFP